MGTFYEKLRVRHAENKARHQRREEAKTLTKERWQTAVDREVVMFNNAHEALKPVFKQVVEDLGIAFKKQDDIQSSLWRHQIFDENYILEVAPSTAMTVTGKRLFEIWIWGQSIQAMHGNKNAHINVNLVVMLHATTFDAWNEKEEREDAWNDDLSTSMCVQVNIWYNGLLKKNGPDPIHLTLPVLAHKVRPSELMEVIAGGFAMISDFYHRLCENQAFWEFNLDSLESAKVFLDLQTRMSNKYLAGLDAQPFETIDLSGYSEVACPA